MKRVLNCIEGAIEKYAIELCVAYVSIYSKTNKQIKIA